MYKNVVALIVPVTASPFAPIVPKLAFWLPVIAPLNTVAPKLLAAAVDVIPDAAVYSPLVLSVVTLAGNVPPARDAAVTGLLVVESVVTPLIEVVVTPDVALNKPLNAAAPVVIDVGVMPPSAIVHAGVVVAVQVPDTPDWVTMDTD